MRFTEKLLSKNSSEDICTKNIGDLGEDEACRYLKKHRYKIIERNYRTRFGEIDIIARDKTYTCFVEVKLRKTHSLTSPLDAVDLKKRERIIRAAKEYAVKNHIYDTPMRFDVISIYADVENNKLKNKQIEVIKDAFQL